MEIAEQKKRPTGMTIFLVLSLLNAILNIFSSVIMFFGTPLMSRMMEDGSFEEAMKPFEATMNAEMRSAMMDSMTALANIKPVFYLFMLVLFVGSLVGVIRMFSSDKRGLHIYAISQLLMLIAASVYKYPLMHPSPFMTDLLLTVLLILIYYLYFKRLELANNHSKGSDNTL